MRIKLTVVLAVLLMSCILAAGCNKVDPELAGKLQGDWIDATGLMMFVDVDNSTIAIKPSDIVDFKIIKAVNSQIELELIRSDQVAGLVCAFETDDRLACRDTNYSGPAFRWYRGSELPQGVEKAAIIQAPKAGGDSEIAAGAGADSGVREEPAGNVSENSQAEPAPGEDATADTPDSSLKKDDNEAEEAQSREAASGRP